MDTRDSRFFLANALAAAAMVATDRRRPYPPRLLPAMSADPPPVQPALQRVGRNNLCPCGSGKKFKRCHLLRPAPESSPEIRW